MTRGGRCRGRHPRRCTHERPRGLLIPSGGGPADAPLETADYSSSSSRDARPSGCAGAAPLDPPGRVRRRDRRGPCVLTVLASAGARMRREVTGPLRRNARSGLAEWSIRPRRKRRCGTDRNPATRAPSHQRHADADAGVGSPCGSRRRLGGRQWQQRHRPSGCGTTHIASARVLPASCSLSSPLNS